MISLIECVYKFLFNLYLFLLHLLRWHYSSVQTFASLMDFSQFLFCIFDFFPLFNFAFINIFLSTTQNKTFTFYHRYFPWPPSACRAPISTLYLCFSFSISFIAPALYNVHTFQFTNLILLILSPCLGQFHSVSLF